jgi:hypothetical protein
LVFAGRSYIRFEWKEVHILDSDKKRLTKVVGEHQ